MNVYICYRWSDDEPDTVDYQGALIVAAGDVAEAERLYARHSAGPTVYASLDVTGTTLFYERWRPVRTEIVAGVTATGEPRVLYDDYTR